MNEYIVPHIKVGFHKSSQKGGEWGCDVEVQEGVVHLGRILTDADDLMDLAATLRRRAQRILAEDVGSHSAQEGTGHSANDTNNERT